MIRLTEEITWNQNGKKARTVILWEWIEVQVHSSPFSNSFWNSAKWMTEGNDRLYSSAIMKKPVHEGDGLTGPFEP